MTKPSTNSSSYLEHRDLLTGLMLPPSHKTPILSLLLVTCSLVCFWPTLSLWNYTLEAACRQLLTTKGFRILPETSHLRHTLLFTVIKTDRIRARRHTSSVSRNKSNQHIPKQFNKKPAMRNATACRDGIFIMPGLFQSTWHSQTEVVQVPALSQCIF